MDVNRTAIKYQREWAWISHISSMRMSSRFSHAENRFIQKEMATTILLSHLLSSHKPCQWKLMIVVLFGKVPSNFAWVWDTAWEMCLFFLNIKKIFSEVVIWTFLSGQSIANGDNPTPPLWDPQRGSTGNGWFLGRVLSKSFHATRTGRSTAPHQISAEPCDLINAHLMHEAELL